MATASPDNLGTVLDQIVQEAAAQAAQQGDRFAQIFDQAQRTVGDVVDQAEKLPADALDKLKQLVDPPDWFSLLVFVLVKISSLDPHLSVGSMRRDGWSRTVTVTYTADGGQTLTLGLALTDPGLKHGIIVSASAPISFGPIGDAFTVQIVAADKCDWTWDFGSAVESPDAQAHVSIDLAWQPPVPDMSIEACNFAVGPLHLSVTLAKGTPDPLYAIALGLGTDAKPGVEAGVHAGKALGALASFVQISDLDERYSPALTVAAGQSPQFTLGHTGL